MAGNIQSLVFTDQSDREYVKKTEETCDEFLNFTYLHKKQQGQETAGNFLSFVEDIYSPDILVSRFGCRF